MYAYTKRDRLKIKCTYTTWELGVMIFSPRVIDYQTKLLAPDKRNLHLSCWSGKTRKLQNQYGLFYHL